MSSHFSIQNGRCQRVARAAGALLAAMLLAALAHAQAPPSKPLYQQIPYDLLKAKNGNDYKCYPLVLPDRYKITIPKIGNLKLQLVDPDAASVDPGDLLIPWRLVESISVFEVMVLNEANEHTRQKRYDAAFPYYAFLEQSYPKTPNLQRSIESYLYNVALDLFQQERYSEALSSLEELADRNPNFALSPTQNVARAISTVTDRMLAKYIGDEDINSSRRMLTRLTAAYGPTQISSVGKWSAELDRRASALRDQARSELDSGKLREAYLTSMEMMRVWPLVQGGKELALETTRRYPIARIAVTSGALDHSPRQIDNWSGRRISRLKHRLLVEYLEPGPSGGIYRSAFGRLEQNDDLTAVYLDLRRPKEEGETVLTAFDVASKLLDRAEPRSPDYSESWASLLAGVDVRNPFELTIQFRRSNVLPEAYLQIPLQFDGPLAALTRGGYAAGKEEEGTTQYLVEKDYAYRSATQPFEVIETVYEHTSDAVNDLRNGKLDVIDRLHPADAARLLVEGSLEIRVGRYAAPTIHVLIPNLKHEFLNRDAFRRALAYAIPREQILNTLLLEGLEMDGARVLDAPFAVDSYGYDDSVPPMPFDASLGKLLTLVAGNELQQIAEKKKEDPPPYVPLVIGHPATKIGRMVSAAIEAQLKALQIECSRKEFPPGEVRDTTGECHLVFAEVQMVEPIVDAERLLSSTGLANSPSPYVGMGIRRLNRAQDWKEASARLKDIHRAAIQNMTIIPLWQLPEHFAYRVGVHGLQDGVLNLYQDIEQWQLEPLLVEEAP
ncbi:MAG: hypothetical protein KDB14_25570 [Planctomycetales bacterium]|nr:hypothetical protein [Planctomycetales bacterium]